MRVFCFLNRPYEGGTGDYVVTALREDGEIVGMHVSSSDSWAKHDIARHLSESDTMEWVDGDPNEHVGVKLAAQRNERMAQEKTGGSGVFVAEDGEPVETSWEKLQNEPRREP